MLPFPYLMTDATTTTRLNDVYENFRIKVKAAKSLAPGDRVTEYEVIKEALDDFSRTTRVWNGKAEVIVSIYTYDHVSDISWQSSVRAERAGCGPIAMPSTTPSIPEITVLSDKFSNNITNTQGKQPSLSKHIHVHNVLFFICRTWNFA